MAGKKYITPRQFAEARGVHYITALQWLRADLIDGAEKVERPDGGVFYRVPESAVTEFKQPRLGRKPKMTGRRKT